MGTVFNIQKYSLHDGPGIRTTVFLKGCPLRCVWCHNPESQELRPEVVFFETRCVGCGSCIKVCPTGVAGSLLTTLANSRTICDTTTLLGWSKDIPVPSASGGDPATSSGRCTACGLCVRACACGAREIVGRSMSADEVMSEVLRDRIFYDQSGGGVTFSGGEPMMQPEFLREMLLRCRAEGLRTTVDTSGFAAWDAFLAIVPLVDLFLYDVKLMDETRHRQYIGASNRLILDNLRRLAPLASSLGETVLARVPLIPGINDDGRNIGSTGEFLRECGIRQVSVLPYHRMGIEKCRRLGREYSLPGIEPPSEEEVKRVVDTLAGYGLSVKVGG